MSGIRTAKRELIIKGIYPCGKIHYFNPHGFTQEECVELFNKQKKQPVMDLDPVKEARALLVQKSWTK